MRHSSSALRKFFFAILSVYACVAPSPAQSENNNAATMTGQTKSQDLASPYQRIIKLDHPTLYVELLIPDEFGFALRYVAINSQSALQPALLELDNPPRLIIDIPENGPRSSRILAVYSRMITQLRFGPISIDPSNSGRSTPTPAFSKTATTPDNSEQTTSPASAGGTRLIIDLALHPIPHPQVSIDQTTGVVSITVSETPLINLPPMESISAGTSDKGSTNKRTEQPAKQPVPVATLSEGSGDKATKERSVAKNAARNKKTLVSRTPVEDSDLAVLDRMYYRVTKSGKELNPAIYFEVRHLRSYEFSRKGATRYQLILLEAKLPTDPNAREKLLLPQYPPQSFSGLLGARATENANRVVIDIETEENYQLEPFRTTGSLWIRAMKKE